MKQLDKNVGVSVLHRGANRAICRQDGEIGHLVEVPSASEIYLYVDEKCSENRYKMSMKLFETAILTGKVGNES